MNESHYDAVIVGAGISGALTAKQLAARGLNVLILEAGIDHGGSSASYRSYHTNFQLTGNVYVLATNAIENAKLAFASNPCPTSGQLGRNLMDHPYVLTWGLAPRPVGPFRGPGSTSSIASLRDGSFRNEAAATRLELANWGWNFAANSPYSDVARLVEEEQLHGPALRAKLRRDIRRQVRIGIMPEQLPSSGNRVSIDPAWLDALGEPRPVIDYTVDDYSRAGPGTTTTCGWSVVAQCPRSPLPTPPSP